jgi:hypothetical protein
MMNMTLEYNVRKNCFLHSHGACSLYFFTQYARTHVRALDWSSPISAQAIYNTTTGEIHNSYAAINILESGARCELADRKTCAVGLPVKQD